MKRYRTIIQDKRKNYLLFIAGTLITAIFYSIVLYYHNPKSAKQETIIVGEYNIVNVPVPTDKIAAGTQIKNVIFKNIPFPKHQIPAGAITDISHILEATTTTQLPALLPLFQENLTFTGLIRNPVIEQIPDGMRAITIKVDATSAVEGWAGSGTIVDVLLITTEKTSVVAEKVKILSTERSTAPVEGKSYPHVPSTATILVSQEQCLAINTAIPLGKIAFALRSTSDAAGWMRTTFTKDHISGSFKKDEKNNSKITGYISVKSASNSQESERFALANGRWIKADIVPQGFFEFERQK